MGDNDELFTRLQESGLPEKTFWKVYCSHAMTYDAFHGRIWRAKNKIPDASNLFTHDFGQPLALSGDWMIVGDVQLPTTDYNFAMLPAAIAQKHLKKPRQLLICGDLMNMDAFSAYENQIGLPGFRQEVEAARALLLTWYKVFDRIVWVSGNHEARISKRSHGSILMQDLGMLVNARVETSEFDRVVIDTSSGKWTVPHGSDYSINQLTIADALVAKYRTHIILHHQHHCSIGFDRYKHNIIIDNGGLFNSWHMAYVQMTTSKKANMQNGFTMLRDGYPHLFSREPFTDWDAWLGNRVKGLKKSA